jgi:hypothetical protein
MKKTLNNRRKQLSEQRLHNIVSKTIHKVLREEFGDNEVEDEQEEHMAVDFYDFYDVLTEMGWSYSDYEDIKLKDGRDAVRFRVNKDRKDSAPIEQVVERLKGMSEIEDGVYLVGGQYRYAPEIKASAIVILYA